MGGRWRKEATETWLEASCNHEAYNTRCFHFPRATIDIIIVWLRVLSLRRVPDSRRGSVRLPANRPISQSNLFRRPALDAIQPANQIDLNGSINQAHLSSRSIPPWPLRRRRRSDRIVFVASLFATRIIQSRRKSDGKSRVRREFERKLGDLQVTGVKIAEFHRNRDVFVVNFPKASSNIIIPKISGR